VITPTPFTKQEYITFLDSLPTHPSALYFASKNGEAEEVTCILQGNPSININWLHDKVRGETALHTACRHGRESVVMVLLAHPDIDVNIRENDTCRTPFYLACLGGAVECVRELLNDGRVDVKRDDYLGRCPLAEASNLGEIDVVKEWMASGREMDLGEPGSKTDAIGAAKTVEEGENGIFREVKVELVALLENFEENQAAARRNVRIELGWYDRVATELFSLVLFFSDRFLEINPDKRDTSLARFFAVAAQLPLELQMVLCYRVVGSVKDIIRGEHIEPAFKRLARRLCFSFV